MDIDFSDIIPKVITVAIGIAVALLDSAGKTRALTPQEAASLAFFRAIIGWLEAL